MHLIDDDLVPGVQGVGAILPGVGARVVRITPGAVVVGAAGIGVPADGRGGVAAGGWGRQEEEQQKQE